jgi:hypothetical protein
MANRFIRKTGSDANGGTSKTDAWATIGKALGASGLASGDICYVGAGVYREADTVAMTSPAAETKLIGDVDGAFTDDAGEVVWTAYTTNDTTAPAASSFLTLAGRSNLTFEKITFVQGNATGINANTTLSQGITFRECLMLTGFQGASSFLAVTGTAGSALNWTLDRCRIFKGSVAFFVITLPTHTADYDANVLIQNCIVQGGSGILCRVDTSGATAGKGGGVDLKKVSQLAGGNALFTNSANLSTTIPCTVDSCFLFTGPPALNANTAGQITVTNTIMIAGAAPLTNVTAGTNCRSDGSIAPLFSVGQEIAIGSDLVPFGTPLAASPLLGWGDDGTAPAVDLLNRPRPAGGASTGKAAGALERHDTAIAGGSANADGATGNCWSMAGPSDQDVLVAVDTVSTTLSIKFKTSSYVGTNYPQIELLANGELGVTGQTVTAGSAATTYTTLTLAAFTPTKKGKVTLRLKNRTSDGAGIVYWDTIGIS